MKSGKTEKQTLRFSIGIAACFALYGIAAGLVYNSSVVTFDGVYSLISVCLSLVALALIPRLSRESDRFPFGKWHFEPALNVIKSVVIFSFCVNSMVRAIQTIINGGKVVELSGAFTYALISTLACAAMYSILKQRNKKINSSILEAESVQWLGDTVLSAAVLTGFIITYLIQDSAYKDFTPFLDPVMVVFASLIFLLFPLKTLTINIRQLLFHGSTDRPNKELMQTVESISNEMNVEYKTYAVTIGRQLFMEVNFYSPKKSFTTEEMDQIRDSIKNKSSGEIWLNVSFTASKEWY